MFQPLDYQLDSLKALHLIYFAFPPPVRVTYYGFRNRHEIVDQIFSKMQSFYSKPLDDTSLAEFFCVYNLPMYFITGGDSPKQQQSGEFGNIFTQPEITGVIPAITNLNFVNEEYIVFSSSGVTRLFEIKNIELSNINENNPLRLWKLNLQLSKYNDVSIFNDRVYLKFEYSYDVNQIFPKSLYDYYFKNVMDTLNLTLKLLENTKNIQSRKNPQITVLLSALYFKFKLICNLLLSKYTYTRLSCFDTQYDNHPISNFFDYPYSITEDMLDIDTRNFNLYQELIDKVNRNDLESIPILDKLISDLKEQKVSPQDYSPEGTSLSYLVILYILLNDFTFFLGNSNGSNQYYI